MKKIILTLFMLLFMAGVSHATLGQTLSAIDTSTSSMTIENDYDVDGDVSGILLYFAEGQNLAPSVLTLVDSIVQGDTPTDPDTFATRTGLKHNTYYSFMTILRDSIGASSDSINYDTSDVYTVLTEGITITNTAEAITYRSFQIHTELANLDSAAKKIVLEYVPSGTAFDSTARMDSATTIDNSDDTLSTPAAPTDLARKTYHWARIIVTDSTGTDTSDIVPVLTLDYDWGTWGEASGWVEPNLYHLKHSWNSTSTTLSQDFSITDYTWVKIWAKLIGFDNNEEDDSAYVYISSTAHGAHVFSDTLLAAKADTARAVEAWFLRPMVSNEVDTLVGAWGTNLILNQTSDSGDTTDIDTRYLEVWLRFVK